MAENSAKPEAEPFGTRSRPDRELRQIFIDVLCDTGNTVLAAKKAGISRKILHRWREQISNFRADWDAALQLAAEALESEAFRRALYGSDTIETTTVARQPADALTGGQTGETTRIVRRSSDALLLALLKAHRPDKYGAPSGRQQEASNTQMVIRNDI